MILIATDFDRNMILIIMILIIICFPWRPTPDIRRRERSLYVRIYGI